MALLKNLKYTEPGEWEFWLALFTVKFQITYI